METTHIIFRQFKTGGKEIIALFPYEPYNQFDVNSINSYMHVGQHGEANYEEVMKITSPCKNESDFDSLYNELVSIGYEDINILEKRNYNFALKNLKENFAY